MGKVAFTVFMKWEEYQFYSTQMSDLLFSHIFLMPSDQNMGEANVNSTVLLKSIPLKNTILLKASHGKINT